jgi:hypothetical protein
MAAGVHARASCRVLIDLLPQITTPNLRAWSLESHLKSIARSVTTPALRAANLIPAWILILLYTTAALASVAKISPKFHPRHCQIRD